MDFTVCADHGDGRHVSCASGVAAPAAASYELSVKLTAFMHLMPKGRTRM